jgi:hypothetical protein
VTNHVVNVLNGRGSRALSYALVALFTGLYILPLLPLGLNIYDEGVRLYGAQRVASGLVPYYDFFAYYAPAQFYWPALLFKVLGEEVWAARLGAAVFVMLAAVSAFAVCRRAGLSQSWSMLPVVALVFPIRAGDQFALCDPALSLVLAADAVLLSAWNGRRRLWLTGLCLGLAAVFRHDFGTFGTFGALAAELWRRWTASDKSMVAPSPLARAGVLAVGLWPLVAGIAIVTVPVYGALALREPRVVLEALLITPAQMMPYRTLPYFFDFPSVQGSLVALSPAITDATRAIILITPPLAALLTGSLLVSRMRRPICQSDERASALILVLMTAACMSVYALGRSDRFHIYPLYVLSVCAGTIILGSHWTGGGVASRAVSVALIPFLTFGLGIHLGVRLAKLQVGAQLNILGASHIRINNDLAWIHDAVRDLAIYSAHGPIFVASKRHDRVHTNALMLYFLSRRPSGTYFHDVIPGVTTTREVQKQIVADLQRNQARTIVVWKSELPDEPNRSRVSSGVFVLDDYLRSAFVRVRQTKDYEILTSRE